MSFKSMKSLLVAVFSLFLLLFPYSAFPQQNTAEHKTTEEKFDPTTAILNHVQDAYEFHFFQVGDFHASIYLPVILYSPQKGFSIFSSKRFGHDHDQTYDGYRMQGENAIVPVNAGEQLYDFSLTRNVIQTFLALALFTILMIKIGNKYKKGHGIISAPSGAQGFMEPIIIFIRDNVGKNNLGNRWERYMPYLLTVFFFILINALFGMIPGAANVAVNIAFTLIL